MIRDRIIPYFGLGFPVYLRNAQTMRIDGAVVPDVDYNKIENAMALSAPLKPYPLTGAEVRFLRKHLGLNQDELAKRLLVSRQSVITWEKAGDEPTPMDHATERMLRLFVLRRKNVRPALFEKAFDLIFSNRPKPRGWRRELRIDRSLNEREIFQKLLADAA